MRAEYKIRAENIEYFESRIEEINKRIARLSKRTNTNFQKISYEIGATEEILDSKGRKKFVRIVEITGIEALINGWQFIATLEHKDAGNIIKTVPRSGLSDSALEQYRQGKPKCDHCNTNRRRNKTYVIRKLDTKELKQVGKTCLQEFFGVGDPHAVASFCEFLIELESACYDEFYESDGLNKPSIYDLGEYLAFVNEAIRDNGWISRTQAKNSCGLYAVFSTADIALTLIDPPANKSYPIPKATDLEFAGKAIAWTKSYFATVDRISDYEHNLKVILDQGYVTYSEIGLAASIVPYYTRKIGEEIERRKTAESKHVGTVGERNTFEDLTLSRQIDFDGMYGVTHMYKFLDASGNVIVWRSNRDLDLIQGNKYSVTGKVIKHDTYKGIKQTQINRCKVK